jgi:membrane-associated protease RseP (regulator of RpoE activity)
VWTTGWLGGGAAGGTLLAASLLSILLAHEMGHYLACRYYGVDATLPFFLPAPVLSFVGTFGAFIRIRSPFPNRRALFDIGIAGPLAGFAVAVPVLCLGILEAKVVDTPPQSAGLISFADPLAFQWAFAWLRGDVPEGRTILIGPLGLAAWFGLFVTALNLIPIGQLDGGHVTYAVFGRRAHALSRWMWWACVALIYFSPSWILWAVLVRLLGRRHPPSLNDLAPLGSVRVAVAVLGAAVFAVCFVPNPILDSWAPFLELFGALGRWLRGSLPG